MAVGGTPTGREPEFSSHQNRHLRFGWEFSGVPNPLPIFLTAVGMDGSAKQNTDRSRIG